MSEEKSNNTSSPTKQPVCIECGELWTWPYYQCKKCTTPEYQATVCRKCTARHMGKHVSKKALLTEMNCVGYGKSPRCGKSPTGTCSSQNPPCSAPLCDNCRDEHVKKHLDSRSDEEKDGDRIRAIIEEIDRDPYLK